MLRPKKNRKIRLKTAAEIGRMRVAGQLVAQAHSLMIKAIEPGITTRAVDRIAEELFERHGATSLFKGYPGKTPFPAVCCISVNEEVVHGIPGSRVLREGDIVSIDTGCKLDGWCGDSAICVGVGEVSEESRRLMKCAEDNLQLAIDQMTRKKKWSQVAMLMEEHVHRHGYSVVEQFVGHGIGQTMHEEPQVPNYRAKSWLKNDFWLDKGLVIAVEPMVNQGGKGVRVLDDQWTVVTSDGRRSVHVEHTLALTADGVEVLTDRSAFE